MPAYLSAKQFEKYYWPYEKQLIEHMAQGGSRMLILLEGRWKHLFEFLKDVARDSCFLMIDDDDIVEAMTELGQYHTIEGGCNITYTRIAKQEDCIERAKRVVDKCAPGFLRLWQRQKLDRPRRRERQPRGGVQLCPRVSGLRKGKAMTAVDPLGEN